MKNKSKKLLIEIEEFKNIINEICKYKKEFKFEKNISFKEITSLIFWTSERINDYLDNNDCLNAAIHYLKCEKAHITSNSILFLDEDISYYNSQQWEYCLSLPYEIKCLTYKLLQSHNLSAETFVNCIATLLIMTGNNIIDILDTCWKERENAIKLLFQSQDTPDDILSQLISGTTSLLSHTYYCIIHPQDNHISLLSVLIYVCKELNIKYNNEDIEEILPLIMQIHSRSNVVTSPVIQNELIIQKSLNSLTYISNRISQDISDIIGTISSLKALGDLRDKLSKEGTDQESLYEVMLNGQNYWGILFQTPFLLSSDKFLRGTFDTLKNSITNRFNMYKKSIKQKVLLFNFK